MRDAWRDDLAQGIELVMHLVSEAEVEGGGWEAGHCSLRSPVSHDGSLGALVEKVAASILPSSLPSYGSLQLKKEL